MDIYTIEDGSSKPNSAFKILSQSNLNQGNLSSREVQGLNVQLRSQRLSSFQPQEL